jgi:hypothetical protein
VQPVVEKGILPFVGIPNVAGGRATASCEEET